MEHILDLSQKNIDLLSTEIFPKINEGNTILLLGAGASVTDKTYLSSQLMSYYKAKTGFDYVTDDIVGFVDVLSKSPDHDRRDFDKYVYDHLIKLKPTDAHRIIASIPWREIITTNYDLLIEKAFDEILGTPDELLTIKPIRNQTDYRYRESNDEVKYVKLNGCISDRNRFPLIFSTQDFYKSNRFYNVVLRTLEQVSYKIQILSIGYSFSDPFGKFLLERFDKYNFIGKRRIVSIDPYVQNALLPYFEEQRIQIVKCTALDFFSKFNDYKKKDGTRYLKNKKFTITDRNNRKINLHTKSELRLSNSIVELTDHHQYKEISPDEFYRGSEPTFNVIKKNLDVVQTSKLNSVLEKIDTGISDSRENDVLPLFILKGGFGSGKSTFGYRVIQSIYDKDELSLGFEIIDPEKVGLADLTNLITSIQDEENVFFLFNNVEVDSAFKSIINLQVGLSAEQIPGKNIAFIIPIRKNIFQKFKLKRSYSNTYEILVDAKFNFQESSELVEKLNESGLIDIRDVSEKKRLAKKIVGEYSGDSFVSLMSIVTNNNFHKIIHHAYLQLSKPVQESFLHTSLLYRFKIEMPISLLNRLTLNNWDRFTKEILEYDSEGILIKDFKESRGTNPDLFLRTRHSVISELLVKHLLNSRDKRYKAYLQLIRRINYTPYNSRLLINLIKALRSSEDLIDQQIDKIFDSCDSEFSNDPHFILHYATNLEKRFDRDEKEKNILKAIEKVIYVQSLSSKQNHYLTHRRAVLNFSLARLYNKKKRKRHLVKSHIDEARELFELKLLLDPFSSYSFVNYLSFEIWNLGEIDDENEAPNRHVKIQELLDRARNQLDIYNRDFIAQIEADYLKLFESIPEKYIEKLKSNEETYHYGLILNYYLFKDEGNQEDIIRTIEELENYTDHEIVNKLLFKFYGRTLFIADHRVRLFKLTREHKELLESDRVRYYFFLAMAEAYNRNFIECRNHINFIKEHFQPNPYLQDYWRDQHGEVEVFRGRLVQNKNHYSVKIIDFQKSFSLKRANYKARGIILVNHQDYNVQLNFYTGGINAEILSKY